MHIETVIFIRFVCFTYGFNIRTRDIMMKWLAGCMEIWIDGWMDGMLATVTVIIEPISCKKKEPLVFQRLRTMKIMRIETSFMIAYVLMSATMFTRE